MRKSLFFGFAAIVSVAGLIQPARALVVPVVPAMRLLFQGDRACPAAPLPCSFPNVRARHRYLHVILHESAEARNWTAGVASTCGGPWTYLHERAGRDDSGFIEVVADLLENGNPPGSLELPACYTFGSGAGTPLNYYSAYFDDDPNPDATDLFPGYQRLSGRPYLPDLDVAYIERRPHYNFDAPLNGPQPGQRVTFVAHVINVGGPAAPKFRYVWSVDGREQATGTAPSQLLASRSEGLTFSWKWDSAPHHLSFRVFPSGPELSTTNDAVSIRTDAITLGFWIERSAYNYFRDHQWLYCQGSGCNGSDSFEDWLQRQVTSWNELFHDAVYFGAAPLGVSTRVRVDKIVVVPDGALARMRGPVTNAGDRKDRSTDLQWGIPSHDVERHFLLTPDAAFNVDWALLHELSHARSLADLYRFDVPLRRGNVIDVTATDGKPVLDVSNPLATRNKLRPFEGDDGGTFLYENKERDLMSCLCTPSYSLYSALVLNRLGNRRARCGNINPPCNLGDWFRDLPPVNTVRIMSKEGHEISKDAKMRMFRDAGTGYGDHAFTDSTAQTLRLGPRGFIMPRDPFASGKSIERAGHNLLLVEVITRSDDQFCFVEPTDFNIAYWEGYTDRRTTAQYNLQLGVQIDNGCELRLPPALVNEPFATSPVRSEVALQAIKGPPAAKNRLLRLRLLDGSRYGRAMRNRRFIVRDAHGRVLARGVTDGAGRAAVRIPGSSERISVDDVTDNHLTFTAR